MLRTYPGRAAIVIALLAFPRVASAGIFDLIWEMSGPQMIGAVLVHCEFNVRSEGRECGVVGKRVAGDAGEPAQRLTWVSVEAAAYVSTGKDSEARAYDAFDTYMLAIEPIFMVRSTTKGQWTFHHGSGVTYNRLFSSDFSSFDKAGLKFRPIGVRWRGAVDFEADFNLRVYPNGFSPDEFGVGPRMEDLDRPTERTYGFSVGVRW